MIDLFSACVGSRAFGIHTEQSDEDIRGVRLTTISDHCNPYALPYNGKGIGDAYFYEWSHFLRLLGSQDPNAWILLMSDECKQGTVAQVTLRSKAIDHMLDSELLIKQCTKLMRRWVEEGIQKADGKLISHGLKIGVFGQYMSHIIPAGCWLGEWRDPILEVKYAYSNRNLGQIREYVNQIEALSYFPGRHVPSDPETTIRALTELYVCFAL